MISLLLQDSERNLSSPRVYSFFSIAIFFVLVQISRTIVGASCGVLLSGNLRLLGNCLTPEHDHAIILIAYIQIINDRQRDHDI